MRKPLRYRIRLVMLDGTVRAGGYVGANRDHVYVADHLTGEVHDVRTAQVKMTDIEPYPLDK